MMILKTGKKDCPLSLITELRGKKGFNKKQGSQRQFLQYKMNYLCGDKNSPNTSPLSNELSRLRMNRAPICWTEINGRTFCLQPKTSL